MTVDQVRALVAEIRMTDRLEDARIFERDLWRRVLEAIPNSEDSSKLCAEALKTLDCTDY